MFLETTTMKIKKSLILNVLRSGGSWMSPRAIREQLKISKDQGPKVKLILRKLVLPEILKHSLTMFPFPIMGSPSTIQSFKLEEIWIV